MDGMDYILDMIDNAPTEDVVPRSEYEELSIELEAMRCAANSYKMHFENAKQEVAREIFEEIEEALAQHSYAQCFQGEVCATSYFDYDLEDSVAELKKKYIGE